MAEMTLFRAEITITSFFNLIFYFNFYMYVSVYTRIHNVAVCLIIIILYGHEQNSNRRPLVAFQG